MKTKKIPSSEITPEHIYNDRRKFIKSLGVGISAAAFSSLAFGKIPSLSHIVPDQSGSSQKNII